MFLQVEAPEYGGEFPPSALKCWTGGVSFSLTSSYVVATRDVDDNNNNISEHERKHDDIDAPKPVRTAPQVSDTPLTPVWLPRIRTDVGHQEKRTSSVAAFVK